MPPITCQSILVIGGSSGISAAVAKLAVAEGLHVSIASSNPTRVSNTIKAIQTPLPNAQIAGYTIDLNTDDVESRLEKLFTDVTAANGSQLDHVILTANIVNMKPVSEVTIPYLRSCRPCEGLHCQNDEGRALAKCGGVSKCFSKWIPVLTASFKQSWEVV